MRDGARPHAVAVTGAAGFIGAAVADALEATGSTVRRLGHRPPPAHDGSPITYGDITDGAFLDAAFAGCAAVVHLAALASLRGTPDDYWRNNVLGTQAVVDACRRQGVSYLVFTSSSTVGSPSNEASRTEVRGYVETKRLAEQTVLAAAASNLQTLALRPALVYAAHEPHFLPCLTRAARSGSLVVVDDGDEPRSITSLGNAAAAHVAALEAMAGHRDLSGQAFHVNDGQPISLWPLVATAIGADTPLRRVSLDDGRRSAGALGYTLAEVEVMGNPRVFDIRETCESLTWSPSDPRAARAALALTAPVNPDRHCDADLHPSRRQTTVITARKRSHR